MSPPAKLLTKFAALAAAILASAAMIVLALPPCGYWFFGWVALVPVFRATRDTRFFVGFIAGLATSMLAGFISIHGFFYTQGKPDGEPMWTYLGFGLFGTVFALVAGTAAEKWNRDIKYLVGLSAAAVLLEASLLWVLPAPFELSQSKNRLMLELASFTGIWGIGFLLWLVNLSITETITKGRKIAPFWFIIAFFFAFMAITNPPFRPKPHYDETVKLGAIQSDSTDLKGLARLSKDAAQAGAKMVVWCEFSGLVHAPGGDTTRLKDLAKQPGMPWFITSYRDAFEPLPHNAAAVFSKLGESKPYFKRRLFGNEVRMHTPGTMPVVANTNNGLVGLNICYDTCFPSIIRDTANLGAYIIAVPTIDPETPYGFFAACHAAFSPIRAAENGVSIIRADGNAYSSIVGPGGEVIAELGPAKDKWVIGDVPFLGYNTLYRLLGDWLLWICAGVLISLAIAGYLSRRRQTRNPAGRRR